MFELTPGKLTSNSKKSVEMPACEYEVTMAVKEARFYDPDLGRFLQVDPAREFWSSYSYVGNNPTLFTDPTGNSTGTNEDGDFGIFYIDPDGNEQFEAVDQFRWLDYREGKAGIGNLYLGKMDEDFGSAEFMVTYWQREDILSEAYLDMKGIQYSGLSLNTARATTDFANIVVSTSVMTTMPSMMIGEFQAVMNLNSIRKLMPKTPAPWLSDDMIALVELDIANKFRTAAYNLTEKWTMELAKRGYGNEIMGAMTDPRFGGAVVRKMQLIARGAQNKVTATVHWFEDVYSKTNFGFKFKGK